MKSKEQRFEDAFDEIMKWYKNENYPLSESLHNRRKRWLAAREWILSWKPLTDSSTVNYLVQTFGVTEPQAWRDVQDTKRFFASMEKANLEYDRIMLIAQIRDLRVKALAKDQFKVAAQCDATLAKLNQGARAEEEAATENVGKHIELVMGFNPKQLGAKEIPNLLQEAERFIGERARQELMMTEWIDSNGNVLS